MTEERTIVLLYYQFVPIEDPQALAKDQRLL